MEQSKWLAGQASLSPMESEEAELELVRVVIIGSVDDGKSTLLGRLLLDSGAACDDHLERLRQQLGGLELALLSDGLEAERQQGITIDLAFHHISTQGRRYLIADAPGHEQYTLNMACGCSTADLALILVDAELGLTQQTRRHTFIASLFGVRHVFVLINKMDKVQWSQQRYLALREALACFTARLDFPDLRFMPISALLGDNVVHRSRQMPWWSGASLLEGLERLHLRSDPNLIDLRFPVQSVVRQARGKRTLLGTLASGKLRLGEELIALPSRERAQVVGLSAAGKAKHEVGAGEAIGIELDRQLDIARGDMLARVFNQPEHVHELELLMLWVGSKPLQLQQQLLARSATQSSLARVTALRYVLDIDSLKRSPRTTLERHEVGRVRLSLERSILVDSYRQNRVTGALVLVDPHSAQTVAAAMVIRRGQGSSSTLLHNRSCVVWCTGLPASGKSTLVEALAAELRSQGHAAVILDGDQVRRTLSRDLGFSVEDRLEQQRRVAAVAALIADSGVHALVSLVSPLKQGRALAREIVGEKFIEVYLATPLATCQARDPKGLYRRAVEGALSNLTGIGASYEIPESPELIIEEADRLTQSVSKVIAAINQSKKSS